MSPTQSPPTAPSDPHALRLTFAYDNSNLRLVNVQRVAMRVPAVATPEPEPDHSGYWFGVRDSAGKLLYHRPVHNPLRHDVETFGDTPEEPFRRLPQQGPTKGEFNLLIPDISGATEFALHGPQTDAAAGTAMMGAAAPVHSTTLVRHDLSELRQMASGDSNGAKTKAAKDEP